MLSDAPHRKPDVTLAHLEALDVVPDRLADLLDGHVDLARTHLDGPALPGGGKVLGVGITELRIDGRRTGRAALHVLVDDLKTLRGALPAEDARGTPIVYDEVGEVRPCAGRAGRYRPAGGGVSIAPAGTQYSGSLGCVVAVRGRRHILGCNHVLADSNTLPVGTAILQPSMQDGGGPADAIAQLSDYVPLVFSPGVFSAANAALAAVVSDGVVDPRIQRNGGVMQALVAPVAAPAIALNVQKSGRTSGDTQGSVQSVGLTIGVQFPRGRALFRNLFAVQNPVGGFVRPGDSGALVTTAPGNQPVGMVIAQSAGGLTYATPMADVLAALTAKTGSPVTIVYA